MTVSSTTTKNSYSGNGSTTVFAYGFKVFDEDDLTVILRTDATGAEAVQSITTNYTVSGVGNTSGGNVTFVTAPASGITVVIRRASPLTQTTDYTPNDPFPAASHEDALDNLTFIAQQQQEELDRAIKLSRTNTMTSTEFTVGATDRANKVLAFDSSGEISVTQEIGTFQGNWAASTAYAERDLVKDTSTNNIFIVNSAHTSSGSQPLTTNTNSSKYDLIVDAASATTSASAAATSATAAATSETNAAASATAAAASEAGVAADAAAAETAKLAAQAAQTAAETAETNAETAETNAETAETNAAASQVAAASSASSASSSASTATTKASEASTSATNAATSATTATTQASTATTKASEAATSATNAATSESNASTSETNAAASAASAAASFDAFDDVYLGAKASAPTVDNDGDALTEGDQYFNTTNNTLFVWNGSAWQAASPDIVGDTTPQLGGALDVNGNSITSASNGDITIDPNGTGDIVLDANVDVTGTVTASSDFVTSGTFGALYKSSDSQILYIAGGNTNASGGNIRLYGGTHSTDASDILLRRGSISVAKLDGGTGDISFFADDGTTQALFFDASTQRLGLGTTAPDALLQIEKSDSGTTINKEPSSQSGPNIAIHNSNQTANNLSSIQFTNRGTNGVAETATAGIHVKHEAQGGTYSYGSMNFNTTNSAGSYATRMHISAGGKVGIGTSSPSSTLELTAVEPTIRLNDSDNNTYSQLRTNNGNLDIRVDHGQGFAGSVMTFSVDNSERMRLDSSGNVGIGSSSPRNASGFVGITLDDTSGSFVDFNDSGTRVMTISGNASGNDINTVTAIPLRFKTNNTERMRLDSSGNLLVGKTSANSTVQGVELSPNGYGIFTPSSNHALLLNRTGTAGAIVTFRYGGTTVGSVGTNSSRTYIGSGSGQSGIKFNTNAIVPVAGADGANSDNTYDLGVSSARFKDAYFSGTVNADALSIDSYSDPTNNYITLRPSFAPSASGGVGFAAKDHDGANNDGLGVFGHDGISFTTGGSERMRLDSSGGVKINTTANVVTGYEQFSVNGTGGFKSGNTTTVAIWNTTTTNNGIQFFSGSGGTGVGSIALGASGTTYNTTSDIRLKESIEPLEATDKLMQMNPVSYNWKADPDGPRSMGFIAQEMQEVMPEAVSTGEDDDAMMSMDYGRITPILVSALQDAHRKIEELAAEIAELKAN